MATRVSVGVTSPALILALLATSCAVASVPTPEPLAALPVLAEGPIAPGTSVVVAPEHGWAECDLPHCGPEPPHARSMRVALTVPTGWEALLESTVLLPSSPRSSVAPDGMGLVIGWNPTGLHADPCLTTQHAPPDIPVGPTVGAFVDALLAHPSLQVSDPVDTSIGGYDGRFLTLTAPSDISGCTDWRPWEGGIAAQGPDNLWDLWVIDVDGLRVVVLASAFPGTSPTDSAELRAMVESIRFEP